MDEKTIFWISLAFTIIGVAAIVIIPFIYGEATAKKISSITESDIGKAVTITGVASTKYRKDNFSIHEIDDGTGKIDMVIFEDLSLKKKKVTATGRIEKYKGKLEIKTEKIIQE